MASAALGVGTAVATASRKAPGCLQLIETLSRGRPSSLLGKESRARWATPCTRRGPALPVIRFRATGAAAPSRQLKWQEAPSSRTRCRL